MTRQYIIVNNSGQLHTLREFCADKGYSEKQYNTLKQRLVRKAQQDEIDNPLSQTRIMRIQSDSNILNPGIAYKEKKPTHSTNFKIHVLITGEVVYGEHNITAKDQLLISINSLNRTYKRPNGEVYTMRGAQYYTKTKLRGENYELAIQRRERAKANYLKRKLKDASK